MDYKIAQEIALKRYRFIAPLVSGNIDTYKSKSDFFRDVGSKAGVHALLRGLYPSAALPVVYRERS